MKNDYHGKGYGLFTERHDVGITRERLSQLSGVSVADIRRWELDGEIIVPLDAQERLRGGFDEARENLYYWRTNLSQDQQEMHLEGLEPVMILPIRPVRVEVCRELGGIKYSEESARWKKQFPFEWERAYLSEWAFHRHLREWGVDHKWSGLYFGVAEEATVDFIFHSGGGDRGVGIRSRRHRDLGRFRKDPWLPYPKPRFDEHRLPDYIVGSSVQTFPVPGCDERYAIAAYWGACEGSVLDERVRTEKLRSRPGTPRYYPIPLAWFPSDVLSDLLATTEAC